MGGKPIQRLRRDDFVAKFCISLRSLITEPTKQIKKKKSAENIFEFRSQQKYNNSAPSPRVLTPSSHHADQGMYSHFFGWGARGVQAYPTADRCDALCGFSFCFHVRFPSRVPGGPRPLVAAACGCREWGNALRRRERQWQFGGYRFGWKNFFLASFRRSSVALPVCPPSPGRLAPFPGLPLDLFHFVIHLSRGHCEELNEHELARVFLFFFIYFLTLWFCCAGGVCETTLFGGKDQSCPTWRR